QFQDWQILKIRVLPPNRGRDVRDGQTESRELFPVLIAGKPADDELRNVSTLVALKTNFDERFRYRDRQQLVRYLLVGHGHSSSVRWRYPICKARDSAELCEADGKHEEGGLSLVFGRRLCYLCATCGAGSLEM